VERAVAYLRISRKDKNIENQKLAILEFAKQRGLEIVQFFVDVCGSTLPPRQRPQYSAMLQFCKLNRIKTIVFYDPSKISRIIAEVLSEVMRLIMEGFNIYFVTEYEEKVYHRPRLIHYVSLYLSGKTKFSELTQEDIEKAKDYVRRLFEKFVKAGATIDGMYREFLAEFAEMYSKFKTAPRSRASFRNLLRDAGLM